jgi:streptogramin lyase
VQSELAHYAQTMHTQVTFISLCLIATADLSSRAAAQVTKADINPAREPAPVAKGEIVAAINPSYGGVFQGKDHHYWFSGGGQGVYRYDGKPGGTITRFTTKDGLPSDQVNGIQQHAPTGDIILSTSNGFSRFDGRAFVTLSAADPSKSKWKLQPDDLWFPAGQDTGAVYRYDGKVLHRLTFPTTKAGDDHYEELPRDKYPNARYSPYDVYIIFRDSRGHVWFGTATLGACRYDGTSFAWFAKPGLEHGSFGTRSIVEDKDGKFWFSSTLNRYTIDAAPAPGNEQGDVAIKYLAEPGVGEDKDAFSVFMSAVNDKNGDLWVATLGAGVFRYDGSRMTQFPVEYKEQAMFGISIYKDRQDNLWLGSQKDGVYKFNGETFERFKP